MLLIPAWAADIHEDQRLSAGQKKIPPLGTPVIIYNDADDPGPMGKPGTVYTDPAATEKRGWDPTDPDPANPWDDAFESGTAIRSQAAWDQWETERENWMSSLTPTDLQGWSTDSKIAGTRG